MDKSLVLVYLIRQQRWEFSSAIGAKGKVRQLDKLAHNTVRLSIDSLMADVRSVIHILPLYLLNGGVGFLLSVSNIIAEGRDA